MDGLNYIRAGKVIEELYERTSISTLFQDGYLLRKWIKEAFLSIRGRYDFVMKTVVLPVDPITKRAIKPNDYVGIVLIDPGSNVDEFGNYIYAKGGINIETIPTTVWETVFDYNINGYVTTMSNVSDIIEYQYATQLGVSRIFHNYIEVDNYIQLNMDTNYTEITLVYLAFQVDVNGEIMITDNSREVCIQYCLHRLFEREKIKHMGVKTIDLYKMHQIESQNAKELYKQEKRHARAVMGMMNDHEHQYIVSLHNKIFLNEN